MMPTITIAEIVETTAVVKAIPAITAIITGKRATLPTTAIAGIPERTARLTNNSGTNGSEQQHGGAITPTIMKMVASQCR
jgi:hypothetical protein